VSRVRRQTPEEEQLTAWLYYPDEIAHPVDPVGGGETLPGEDGPEVIAELVGKCGVVRDLYSQPSADSLPDLLTCRSPHPTQDHLFWLGQVDEEGSPGLHPVVGSCHPLHGQLSVLAGPKYRRPAGCSGRPASRPTRPGSTVWRKTITTIAVRCSVVPARVMARRASASDSLTANGGAGCAAMSGSVRFPDSRIKTIARHDTSGWRFAPRVTGRSEADRSGPCAHPAGAATPG
jgi:hypothetical protein